MKIKLYMIAAAAVLSLPVYAGESGVVLDADSCRALAVANNENLRRATNDARRAELDKEIAFTAYLPDLSATAAAMYLVEEPDMMGTKLSMKGTYLAGVSLTQPLYAGGRIRAANKLGEIGMECAAETERKERMRVIADADNAYWSYVAVLKKVDLLEVYRQQMDTLLDRTETSVKAEMATSNDLLRIETKRSEIMYQLQKAKNGAELCRLALCNATGLDFDTEISPVDADIDVAMPGLLDDDISRRPELVLLQKQIDAREEQVQMARADILPTLGLSVGYMYLGNIKMKGVFDAGNGVMAPFTNTMNDGYTTAMATLSIPIFHWGEGRKKVKQARIDVDNARLELEENSRLMKIEARQAMQNVTDSYNMIATAKLGLRQAEENLRVMRRKYEVQMCTLTDLLDAQSQWQQAYSNHIEAQSQFKIYESEYYRVTGRLEL